MGKPKTLNRGAAGEFLQVLQALPEKDGVRQFPDKGWLQRQGTERGLSGAWGAAMLSGMAQRGTLQIVKEGRAIRGVILVGAAQPTPQAATPTAAEPQPEPEQQPEQPVSSSLRDRLVALLQREADEHGKVRMSTDDIRRRLDVSIHDAVKMLYDLKKAGLLAFRETRSGKSMNLLAFRLQGDLKPRVAPADGAMAPWSICPECYWDRKYHRKGDDRTVLICPEPPKQGSPRWEAREHGKPVGSPVRSRASGNIGHRAPERTEKPGPVVRYWECHEPPVDTTIAVLQADGTAICGQKFTDPVGLRMHKEAKHSGEPLPQNVRAVDMLPARDLDALAPAPEPQATPTAQVVTDAHSDEGSSLLVVDWAAYPLLTEAARVYHARMQAMALLESVGDSTLDFKTRPVGQAGTGTRIAEEITRLLVALGYEGVTNDKA